MIERIAELPRVSLGCYPTPLTDASHLSEVLGGPRILIKRDDLTGLALGGNKCRRLEYLIGYVKEQGFDSFVISGVSNMSIQLAAAAAKLGMKVRQIVHGDVGSKGKQGNYILHRILNSDMRISSDTGVIAPTGPAETLDDVKAKMYSALANEAAKLRDEGYKPFVMRSFDPTPVENAGWVNAVDEIQQQLEALNAQAQYVVVANAGSANQAGLAVGAKYLRTPFRIIGVSTLYTGAKATSEVVRIANETASFLELGMTITPDEITVYDEYVGEGYGKTTKECIEAIGLVAQTEGIFLDPVYTGKAMAGLIDLIHKGRFTSKDTVVFMHTGGSPSLFAYGEELAAKTG